MIGTLIAVAYASIASKCLGLTDGKAGRQASASTVLIKCHDLTLLSLPWRGQLKRFALGRLSKSLSRSAVEVASAEFGVLKV
jgi:hypothetical protein